MEETSPTPQPVEKIKQANKPKWPWIILGIVAIGLAGGGTYYYATRQKNTTDTNGKAANTSATTSPLAEVSPVVDAGATWLSEPQQLDNLSLFEAPKDNTYLNASDIVYYKVGTDAGQDIVLALLPSVGPGAQGIFRFLKVDSGSYQLLTQVSDKQDEAGTYYEYALSNKVTKNTTKSYKSIADQENLTVNGVTITSVGNGFNSWFLDEKLTAEDSQERIKLTEYASTPYGKLYNYAIDNGDFNYTTESFVLRRPDGTSTRYQLRPAFIKDDYVPTITWNDGTTNMAVYRIDGISSCGTPAGVSVLPANTINDLQPAGKASTGETIYGFSNKNNKTLQAIWGQYNEMGKSMEPPKSVSIDDYIKQHAVIAYKDKLGRLILLNGGEYGALAECGKPVIYLYPEKTQSVSVKVGANVTVSEPAYNNGWTVTAQPNGALTNSDGMKYDSLFWEGTGKEYPEIREGFVVAQKDIESTLRDHLTKLGLNTKESNDFMEFWLPKMPNTPYVRLTWFGTRQMDRLAPLTVKPAPDTTIRIFLDFEGLQQPVKLPAQRLTAVPRKGFTLVEWGGLLRK